MQPFIFVVSEVINQHTYTQGHNDFCTAEVLKFYSIRHVFLMFLKLSHSCSDKEFSTLNPVLVK